MLPAIAAALFFTSSALADSPAAVDDVQTAAQAVANGTADAQQTAEVQGVYDYLAYNYGISTVPYNAAAAAGQPLWTGAPYWAGQLESVPPPVSGSATSSAIGAEGLDAAGSSGAGLVPDLADVVAAGSGGGLLFPLAASASALGAGYLIGTGLRAAFVGIFGDDGGGNIQPNSQGTNHPAVPVATKWVPVWNIQTHNPYTGDACVMAANDLPASSANQNLNNRQTLGSLGYGGFPTSGSIYSGPNGDVGTDPGIYLYGTTPPCKGRAWVMTREFTYQGSTTPFEYGWRGSPEPMVVSCPSGLDSYTTSVIGTGGNGSSSSGIEGLSMSTQIQSNCTADDGVVGHGAFDFESAYKYPWQLKTAFPVTGGSCPTGVTCYTAQPNPSSSWATLGAFAGNLAANATHWHDLIQYIDSVLDSQNPSSTPASPGGGTTAPPLPGQLAVPNCEGMTVSTCNSTLATAGFTATPTTSVLAAQYAVPADGANKVVSTTPAAGIYADKAAPFIENVNPSTFNIVVPAPTANEVLTSYEHDLTTIGFTATPAVTVVSTANESATAGPNAVLTVSPAPGTSVAPSTVVQLQVNPADAPAAGAGTAAQPFTAPTVPSLDLSPLSKPINCNSFPFGVPCWMASTIGNLFSSPGTCPDWQQRLGPVSWNLNLDVNLCSIQTARNIWYPVMIVVSFIGLAWAFFKLATGNGDGDES